MLLATKDREIGETMLSGKRRWWILVLLLVIGVGLVEYLNRPRPLPVILQQVERGQVEAIVANTRAGTVKACRRAHLAPQGGGQIAMLQVHVGDRVEAGQVLLTLWNEDLKAQLRLAQSEQKAAVANAEQICLKTEEAQRDARRQKSLKDKGQISEEAYDRSVTNAMAGEASCRAARAQVGIAESRIDVAAAALERTLLKAPFAGYVAEVNGELGEYVTPSPPGIPTLPAIDLVDTSCLYISAPIDEVDAPSIKIGMLARITLDAVAGHHFLGAVDRIAPYVQEQEKQARTVEVEALFANPDEYKDLIPGYSADLEIIVAKRDDVLRIPTEAVMEGGQVLVFPPNSGVLEARKIKTGLTNWQYTEVVSGLSESEQVVVSVGRPGVEAGVMAKPERPATGQ
jgi:HlyD family secretion protein